MLKMGKIGMRDTTEIELTILINKCGPLEAKGLFKYTFISRSCMTQNSGDFDLSWRLWRNGWFTIVSWTFCANKLSGDFQQHKC